MAESVEMKQEREPIKPRSPWLAGLLSLVATGLGQVYNGQWKKGAGFFAAEVFVTTTMIRFWADFGSMLLCLAILFGYNLFVAGEAFASARKQTGYTLQPYNRWWVYGLCLLVSACFGVVLEKVIEGHFYKAYKAPSGSMLPTILTGDRFMVEVLSDDDSVERGYIVIFSSPETDGKDFVKRIVGLPGETVEILDKAVFINGQPLEEPYARHSKPDMRPLRDNFGPVSLGADEYFVLGDNREDSYDSRWLGPVKRGRIIGRARYVYFPAEFGVDGWSERLGSEYE